MTSYSGRMLHKLPVEAYTDQNWFDQEQEVIFSKTWRFAGLREDIKEPGDHIAIQAGLNNIFVIMGRDYRLRAFHNMCRHRGTQLLRGAGKAKKSITCPYHDWTYDLEGKLLSIPEENSEFVGVDKTCLSLKQASVDIWRGMIFVHPDFNAPSIIQWFGEVEKYLAPYNIDELMEAPDSYSVTEIKANWKIVVENYIDHYHLSHLHSGTLSMYDHAKAEFDFIGPHFAFWEPLTKEYEENIDTAKLAPLLLPKDALGAYVPMLFPGIGLGESETSWSTYIITPLAPNLTRVESRSKVKQASEREFNKLAKKSQSFWEKMIQPKSDGDPKTDPMATGDFMAEDVYACEQQQKALYSPYFEVGPAASHGESPVLGHQQVVLDYMEKKK